MFPVFSATASGNHPDRLRGVLPVLGLAGGMALLAWNWALAVSLGLGAMVTVLLYRLQVSPWQGWLQLGQQTLQAFFKSPHRFLIVSLLGGGLTLGGTYFTAALWKDLHSLWLTAGFALEGMGLVALFSWGMVQTHDRQTQLEAESIDQILTTLRHGDPLQRLQGIYRADRLGQSTALSSEQVQILMNSLAILVQQEAIVEVRDTALDALHRLYDRLNT